MNLNQILLNERTVPTFRDIAANFSYFNETIEPGDTQYKFEAVLWTLTNSGSANAVGICSCPDCLMSRVPVWSGDGSFDAND